MRGFKQRLRGCDCLCRWTERNREKMWQKVVPLDASERISFNLSNRHWPSVNLTQFLAHGRPALSLKLVSSCNLPTPHQSLTLPHFQLSPSLRPLPRSRSHLHLKIWVNRITHSTAPSGLHVPRIDNEECVRGGGHHSVWVEYGLEFGGVWYQQRGGGSMRGASL